MGRRDGKRIKNLSGMGQLIMDINPKRVESEVYINEKIDVTNLVEFMKKKKKDNENITLFHAFLTAFGKTIYNRKKLNYFVANRHLYEHNEISMAFVAKIEFNDKSAEEMIVVDLDNNDTLDSISEKICTHIKKIRDKKERKKEENKNKGANSAMNFFGKLPNILRVPIVGLFKILDRHGKLPKDFTEQNIYFSSMVVSNLGSIKCGACYHHLADFGTCSSLVTIGEIKDEVSVIDGKEEVRKICEIGVTLDERVADGLYYASALKIVAKICNEPELLEEKISTKIEYKVR